MPFRSRANDRPLPDAALPYMIDPVTYSIGPTSIECSGIDTGTTCYIDFGQRELTFSAKFNVTLPTGATVLSAGVATDSQTSCPDDVRISLTTPSETTSGSTASLSQLGWLTLTHGGAVAFNYSVECSYAIVSDAATLSITYTMPPVLSFSANFPSPNPGTWGSISISASDGAGLYRGAKQLILNTSAMTA